MNIKSFNLVISSILLIPYAVKADGALKTVDKSGTKCTTTLSLCELDSSKIASLGLKGDKGERGDVGLKGEPGLCAESDMPSRALEEEHPPGETDEAGSKDDTPAWGTIDNPGKTTCKNAPIDKTGTYYIYNSMEVICDVKKKTTCVKINANPSDVSFRDTKPFWLSSKDIEFRDIYNLSNTQLAWLQARSDTASIRIRYHCVNTKPAQRDAPVLLLSWNDAIIGPKATALSPFNYDVENDRCSTAADDFWSFTDIVIRNTSAHRLPIVDFYVQYNAKPDQHHKITVAELCFH